MPAQNIDEYWYVIVRKDNGHPLQVFAEHDKGLAEHVAEVNGEKLVAVEPLRE